MTGGGFLVTWLAVAGAAFAAVQLALTLTVSGPPEYTAPPLEVLASLDSSGDDRLGNGDWPALFGVAAVAEAPKPVVQTRPNTSFTLKGLVAGAADAWAILSDGEAETLVRTGDTLSDGSVVARIDRHGVFLDLDGRISSVSFGDGDAETRDVATTADSSDDSQPAPAAPILKRQINLDVSGLHATDIRRLLAGAGAAVQVDLPDGTSALDVLWTRPGQLYEKLGLEAGDRLLTINDLQAGDNKALLDSLHDLVSSDEYRLDIIRGGERLAVTVKLVNNG